MNRLRRATSAVLVLAALLTLNSVWAQDGEIPTPTATRTVIDLSDQWQLSGQTIIEETEQPHLSITVSIPVLTGADSDVAANFNQAVETIVSENADSFRDQNSVLELPPEIAELGSFFELNYEVFTATDELISIRFTAFFYSAGAAHPGSYSIPLNFDLENGKTLTLADLFKSDAAYLELLSIYAIQDLQSDDMLLFPEGADPTEDNYRSWNVTADGLLITFDEYQVGPYAAGAQEVVIPYAAIPGIIDPNGPLASFANTGSVQG